MSALPKHASLVQLRRLLRKLDRAHTSDESNCPACRVEQHLQQLRLRHIPHHVQVQRHVIPQPQERPESIRGRHHHMRLVRQRGVPLDLEHLPVHFHQRGGDGKLNRSRHTDTQTQ